MRQHALLRTILGVAMAGAAVAFVAPAMAAVNPPQQVLSAQAVKQFLANPNGLLTQYPNGGPEMTKAVQDLAASDPATLNALLGLLANADPEQAKAIGTALGDVAKAVAGNNPGYATQIQVGIVLANNDSALGAFNAVVGGDIQLTSVTGGVGGGGGGGGGPTGTTGGFGGGILGTPGTFPTATTNTPDSFLSSSFSPGTPGTTTSTITFSLSSTTP